MSEGWSVPGYDVEQLLGVGATGEIWRAREHATGETVALRRLRPAGRVVLDALRQAAAALAALETPYVVRLRAVTGDDDEPVLVLDHAAGGSLAALLARRGSLTPGEVVTIGGPLAQALATAHARGLVHANLSPASVLFRADGMPLLGDLGLAALTGGRQAGLDGAVAYVDPAVVRGGKADAAADVWALAAVCHHLLAGTPPYVGASVDEVLSAEATGCRTPLAVLVPAAPSALVAVVEAGLSSDPAQRPDAAAFAARLRRAHATAPVRLSGIPAATPATHPPSPRAGRRHAARPAHAAVRRWARPVLVAVVAVLALAAAATAGWVSGQGAPPIPPLPVAAAVVPDQAPAPVAPPARLRARSPVRSSSAATEWVAVLDRLAQARADAFAAGDPDALFSVYAVGAPGLDADRAQIARLETTGHRAHGVRHAVHSAALLSAAPGSVLLRVVDELPGYELRDRAGTVVERATGRPAAARVVELVETPDGWRVAAVDLA